MNFIKVIAVSVAFFTPTPVEATLISTTTPVLPPIMKKIAWCESRNKATAKNPYSTASGRFQFLKGSWNYYGKLYWGDDLINKDVFNYNDNTELALWVYKRNGTRDWNASKACWSPVNDG